MLVGLHCLGRSGRVLVPQRVQQPADGDDPIGFEEKPLGRPITYLPVSDDTKRKTLLGYGVPQWIVDMIEEYAHAFGSGGGDLTTDTVAALLGRSPRDIAGFARDHTAAFTSAGDN